MKLLRKGAAILLAASLCVLSACSRDTPAPDNKTAMGRYIEDRWELPIDAVNISVLTRRPDGKIFAIMNDMGVIGDGSDVTIKGFSTSDGKDWAEDSPPWLGVLREKGGFVYDLAYGKNGECFLIYDIMEDGNYYRRVAWITPDGTPRDIEGEWEKAMQDSEIITYTTTPFVSDASTEESSGEESPAAEEPSAAAAIGVAVDEAEDKTETDEAEQTAVTNSFYPTGIAVGDDGDIYIAHRHAVGRFDAEGRFKANLGNSYPEFTYYDGSLAILDYGSVRGDVDTFKLYDTDTGEARQDLGLRALQSPQQGARIATGQDGALYLANPNGIYRLVPQGTTWERMVDGDLCSLSVPSMYINMFIPHGDNEFLILTTERDKPALVNYIYSASTPTRPNTELTIAALNKNNTLLQAAGEFRRLHPEVLVTVQILLEEDGSATTADAIRALNTQLLAGKGPDLLLLDGLPIDSYIEKGVLADMSDWLSPITEQELVPNVAEAFENNGKLYAVPARFNLPTIWGRPEAVREASDLQSVVKYAESNKDRKLLYAMDRESMFRFFYNASAPAWLDGKGKLNESAFAEYLELINRLADSLSVNTKKADEVRTSPGYTMDGIDTGGAVEVAYGKANLFGAELFGFNSVIVPNGTISALNGVAITANTTSVEDSLIPFHISLLPGQAAGVFIPRCVMGINAAGKQQELAQEFIQTILGEPVQYSDLQDGFPVNRAAIEKNILRKDDLWMSFSGEDEETGEPTYMEMSWPSPGVFRAVCALFDKLDTPYMPDDTLMEMILDETFGFFSGSLSARETASAMAARLELYLAEQS